MSVARRIVIDDSDEHVNYTGGWIQEQSKFYDNVGNFGPTYLSTTHSTFSGGVLTFPFNGTSIEVYGTTAISGKPSWDCYVDGTKFEASPAFSSPENNWPLCEVDTITDGQHDLTINVTSSNGATFAFDYIEYTPSPDSASLDYTVVKVHHTDSALNYSSTGWSDFGDAASTNVPGSQLQFSFIGKSLSWVGYIPVELAKQAANGTYTVDGGSPISFKLDGSDESATTSVYHQTFFATQDLPQGPHTIIVTYGGDSTHTPLTMNYLLVTNSSASSEETSPQAITATKSDIPVGAIVGVSVGVLLFITAIVAFLFLRQKRRNARPQPYDLTAEPENFDPFHHATTPFSEPYLPTREEIPMASRSHVSLQYARSISASSQTSFKRYSATSWDVSSTASFMPGHYKSSISKQNEAGLDNPNNFLVHQDSGFRMNGGGHVEELPPNYSDM